MITKNIVVSFNKKKNFLNVIEKTSQLVNEDSLLQGQGDICTCEMEFVPFRSGSWLVDLGSSLCFSLSFLEGS